MGRQQHAIVVPKPLVRLRPPRTAPSLLHQRRTIDGLRGAGATAHCANSARLYLDGDYDGPNTHLKNVKACQ